MSIHPSAVIDPGAEIVEDVTVGPFCYVHGGARLERGVRLESHVVVYPHTTIGEETVVYPQASLGGLPQSIGFPPERPSTTRIGARVVIREGVTIHRPITEGAETSVGDDSYLMAYCHIGHDCVLGKRVIVTSLAGLAGHCLLEDYAIVGGVTGVHQFVRIGTMAMVGGVSRITTDCPPYVLTAGVPQKEAGLNLIGLRRNGVSPEAIQGLKAAYRLLYRSNLNRSQALQRIRDEVPAGPEVDHLVEFLSAVDTGAKGRALDR